MSGRVLTMVLLLFALAPATASAVSFTVNSTTDVVDATPGDGTCATAGAVCTLRAAIQEANALAGNDQIFLPAGTFALSIAGDNEDAATTGDLDVTSQVNISGLSARSTVIQAVAGDRIFDVQAAGNLLMNGVTITGANYGGEGAGIRNLGNLIIASIAIRNNTAAANGGGILNDGGTLQVGYAEISGNTAGQGAGIQNQGAATVINSTISDNTGLAGITETGIATSLDIQYTTIAGNGYGISGVGPAAQLSNSIIADNVTADCQNAVNSLGHNVVGDASCLLAPAAGDASSTDPQLSALANNGGQSDTRAIGPTSPALDRGVAPCFSPDQRDAPRPSGPACDSGAYERLVPPETTIDDGPTGNTVQNGALIAFSANEVGATFECSLDGAAFAACTSPQPYSNLAPGPHTVAVRALGTGGTDPTPATRSWTVVVSDTVIDSGPPAVTGSTDATFAFHVSEAGATALCSLDGLAYDACNSPKTYSGLNAGTHSFAVKATAPSGEDASPATGVWRVAAAPDTAIDSGPAATTSDRLAVFAFSSAEAGATFECALDDIPFSACTSPVRVTVAEGRHTFSVRSIGPGGTDGTPATRSWTYTAAADPPVFSKAVTAAPVSGSVKVRIPGTSKYVPLDELDTIPFGSTVDATKGRVKLTAEASPDGKLQTAEFYDGSFKLTQEKAAKRVLLTLVGGDFSKCPKPSKKARASATGPKTQIRKLWGKGKGKWRVRGKVGSATVRGTWWLVSDRCDGTLVKVRQGVVDVRDEPRRRTVKVKAGTSYLARARR